MVTATMVEIDGRRLNSSEELREIHPERSRVLAEWVEIYSESWFGGRGDHEIIIDLLWMPCLR
jgi:hypothetical protein